MTLAIYICRGNRSGHWGAEGGYDPVAEVLFNELDVDAYFLEYDTPYVQGPSRRCGLSLQAKRWSWGS